MSLFLSSPIFWLTTTLLLFAAVDRLCLWSNRHPLFHPVLLATPLLIGLLLLTGTSYKHYLEGTQVLGFLLGPAVVGLGVPVWQQRGLIRQLAIPILLALLAGAITAIVSAVGILWLFGAPGPILASIAPRATTTPVAMAVAQQLGGIPPLAAVIVLFAGVVGGMTATPLFNAMKQRDYRARGFALGVSAHGFGAARAFQLSATAGAFASVGLALNAVMTALLLSLLALWL